MNPNSPNFNGPNAEKVSSQRGGRGGAAGRGGPPGRGRGRF